MEVSDKIFITQDGSPSIISRKYGVSYHSKYGAIQETKHVFIEAGLYPQFIVGKEIAILEFGLGTGLNAYMTQLETEDRAVSIYYEAIEAFPISLAAARQLNYPALLGRPSGEASIFYQLHEREWDQLHSLTPQFSFLKKLARFENLSYDPSFDLIYFDAFAPTAQPELWEPPILKKAYEALKPGGTFVTYCAKGIVKRHLKSLGFSVEALPGPPGKREMTRAVKR